METNAQKLHLVQHQHGKKSLRMYRTAINVAQERSGERREDSPRTSKTNRAHSPQQQEPREEYRRQRSIKEIYHRLVPEQLARLKSTTRLEGVETEDTELLAGRKQEVYSQQSIEL